MLHVAIQQCVLHTIVTFNNAFRKSVTFNARKKSKTMSRSAKKVIRKTIFLPESTASQMMTLREVVLLQNFFLDVSNLILV